MAEVVRFDRGDVIATSGYGEVKNGVYNVMSSEINQAIFSAPSTGSKDGNYIEFDNGSLHKSLGYISNFFDPTSDSDSALTSYNYAWYDGGKWMTEDKKVAQYGNNLPIGGGEYFTKPNP